METTIHQAIQQAITAHKAGKLEEAENLYREILETQPTHPDAHYNLGNVMIDLARFKEAEASYKKAIELKPDYTEAYNNLGNLMIELARFEEAEASYKKAIELKPEFVQAHMNLGSAFKELHKLNEAEASYKKAIELKPDYAKAYYHLGLTLQNLARLEEAEASYKKAIELKPNFIEASHSLDFVLKQKRLLLNILQAKKTEDKTKVNLNNKSNLGDGIRLISNPFISKRKVESELLPNLYKISSIGLDKTKKNDARYGNGRCSTDFQLFENDNFIIKNVEEDLVNIMRQAVKSEVFVMDSFFNILSAGSGTTPHKHVRQFDKISGLINQKYSLTYYLSVGDQNCSEPGILKLYDPDKEILPSEGMIVIIPSVRSHSAIYGGKKDRVMIGINFYSLI